MYSWLRRRALILPALMAALAGCAGAGLPPPVYMEPDARPEHLLQTDEPGATEQTAARSDPFALAPETRSWIRERVGTKGSTGRRLDELAALFANGGPLQLDYDLVASQGAEATLEAGRGNCLSFTILFVALARELGLDARVQEVPVARTWSRVEDTVVSDRHVIASGRTPRGFWEVDFGRLTRPAGEPREPLADRVVAAMLESNRGASALSRGDSAEALDLLRRSARMAPELEQSWVNLGVALGRIGAAADAELAFRTALVHQPGEPSALSGLMRLYRETGATATADALEAVLPRLLEQNPYHLYNRGLQAERDGEPGRARALFARAVRARPDEPWFHTALIRASLEAGDLEGGRVALLQARARVDDPEELRRILAAELLGDEEGESAGSRLPGTRRLVPSTQQLRPGRDW